MSTTSEVSELNEVEPTSIPYLVFLYLDELKARGQVMSDPGYKYEIKYNLTDELVHKNFGLARRYTSMEVGLIQDSVIYKKRLRLTIAKIRNPQQFKKPRKDGN